MLVGITSTFIYKCSKSYILYRHLHRFSKIANENNQKFWLRISLSIFRPMYYVVLEAYSRLSDAKISFFFTKKKFINKNHCSIVIICRAIFHSLFSFCFASCIQVFQICAFFRMTCQCVLFFNACARICVGDFLQVAFRIQFGWHFNICLLCVSLSPQTPSQYQYEERKKKSVGMEWLHFMCIGTLKLVNRASNRCYVYKNKNSNSREIKFTNAQKKSNNNTMCECHTIFILFSSLFACSFNFVCSFGIYIFFFFCLLVEPLNFFLKQKTLFFMVLFFLNFSCI